MERALPIAMPKKGTRVGGSQSPIKVIFQFGKHNTLNPPRGIIFTFYRTLLLVTMYLINGYTPHHEQGARNTPCHFVLDSSLHTYIYIHTKLYLLTLAPTTISRLISMGGVKYTINYLQKIRKYKKKIKVRLHYWKT